MPARTLYALLALALVVPLVACGGRTGEPDAPAVAEATAERDRQGKRATEAGKAAVDAEPRRTTRSRARDAGRDASARRSERRARQRSASARKDRRERSERRRSEPRRPAARKEAARAPAAQERADDATAWRFDEAEVHAASNTMRDYFKRLNAHDGSLCAELLTQSFVEQMTGRRGDAAVARCREQISGSKLPARLRSLDAGRVRDREALIQYTATVGAMTRSAVAHLVEQDGRYRLNGDGSRLARDAQ